jgi:hypothetical protein
MVRGGQIVDASIVRVQTQRNSRDESDELRAGRTYRRMEAEARQVAAEGRGCALDQEAWSRLRRADLHFLIYHVGNGLTLEVIELGWERPPKALEGIYC